MMRTAKVGAGLVAVALLAGGGYLLAGRGGSALTTTSYCEAVVDGSTARVGLDQAGNAAIIAAVAVRRRLPARAVSIALATAYQESKIRNLSYGDRDSLGIFQQRPSQGWGTAAQVRDPYHATGAFYDALQRVDGYQSMPIHDAAQLVQHSADGTAYAQHEQSARVLASALTGYSPAAFRCRLQAPTPSGQSPGPGGLTAEARAVMRDVHRAFGALASGSAASPAGTGLDFAVSGGDQQTGWALAHYLVARASALHVSTVIHDGRVWSAGSSVGGWQPYAPASGTRYHDAVHVDVA